MLKDISVSITKCMWWYRLSVIHVKFSQTFHLSHCFRATQLFTTVSCIELFPLQCSFSKLTPVLRGKVFLLHSSFLTTILRFRDIWCIVFRPVIFVSHNGRTVPSRSLLKDGQIDKQTKQRTSSQVEIWSTSTFMTSTFQWKLQLSSFQLHRMCVYR